MITHIQSPTEAESLAQDLLRRGRTRPAVVVSVSVSAGEPFIDVAELSKAVGDDCEVYVIRTGELTYAFAGALPAGREVYGGASRVYAVDNAWVQDQYRSPLRFAFAPDADERVLNLLIEDAMSAAHAAGLGQRPTTQRARRRVTGAVRGTVAGRALVDVGGVWPAVTYPDRLLPGVGADHMFREEMQVEGLLDPDTNVLHLEGVREAAHALAAVDVETVLLARVGEVRASSVSLEVYPGVRVVVSQEGSEDDLRVSYTSGEVVPVEVKSMGSAGTPTSVQVLPATFADMAEPVALLDGGPHWLPQPVPEVPGELAGSGEEQEPDVLVSPVRARSVGEQEVVGLTEEVLRLQGMVERLEKELQAARIRTREGRRQVDQLGKEVARLNAGRDLVTPGIFADPGQQFLHEVYVSWAERTTAADKEDHPWRAPRLGPDLLASLDHLQGIDRSKVVDVAADVACGRADTISARAVHQLRSGPGGDDAPVTREGGETCWRVSLQHKSPSARRMHFWRQTDGSVELSSLRVHDDFRP